MKITQTEKNKKNPELISIYLDGHFAFRMCEEDYLTMGLYEESEISEEQVEHIRNVLNIRSAKSKAIQFVSYKLRSEREVRIKLSECGFMEDTIEQVIYELCSMGYINDRIYAQKYVFDRSKLKPKAGKMLRYELAQKGIRGEIIDEVLDQMELDDSLVAEGLVKKKFGKYDLTDDNVMKKAVSFLRHRGFDFETIQKVVESTRERI